MVGEHHARREEQRIARQERSEDERALEEDEREDDDPDGRGPASPRNPAATVVAVSPSTCPEGSGTNFAPVLGARSRPGPAPAPAPDGRSTTMGRIDAVTMAMIMNSMLAFTKANWPSQ